MFQAAKATKNPKGQPATAQSAWPASQEPTPNTVTI
jgi:hypothetical protein